MADQREGFATSSMMYAVKAFDGAEANLRKAERLWAKIDAALPRGNSYDPPEDLDDWRRSFQIMIDSLPPIDGWKPEIDVPDAMEVFRTQIDIDTFDIDGALSLESFITAPRVALKEYRFRLTRKRKSLTRDALQYAVQGVDEALEKLVKSVPENAVGRLDDTAWNEFRSKIAEIDVLRGSGTPPPRWGDLHRHMGFGFVQDLHDIASFDWPKARLQTRSEPEREQGGEGNGG